MKVKQENQFSIKEKKLGMQIWSRLSRIYSAQLRNSNLFLKKWELTIAQFDALTQIGANKRLSQKELAEKLFVTRGNITQLLGKMEASGYILREQEWKTKYLSLTEKGIELVSEAVPMQETFQASQFLNLTKKEQKQLLKLLKKLSGEG